MYTYLLTQVTVVGFFKQTYLCISPMQQSCLISCTLLPLPTLLSCHAVDYVCWFCLISSLPPDCGSSFRFWYFFAILFTFTFFFIYLQLPFSSAFGLVRFLVRILFLSLACDVYLLYHVNKLISNTTIVMPTIKQTDERRHDRETNHQQCRCSAVRCSYVYVCVCVCGVNHLSLALYFSTK